MSVNLSISHQRLNVGSKGTECPENYLELTGEIKYMEKESEYMLLAKTHSQTVLEKKLA